MSTYFLTSKRFWLNFITIAVGVIGLVTKQFPVYADMGAMVVGILNLILATISQQPLGWTLGWTRRFGFKRK